MARRKTSEVLITGDVVDSRARVGVSSPATKAPLKKPSGAFPEDHLERRPRKTPKVIEVPSDKAAKPTAATDLADLERELGMTPTAATGEALSDGLPDSSGHRTPEDELNWQAIQRAKKPEFDLPPQTDPEPKKNSPDNFDLSQPVIPKPVVDIAPPPKPVPTSKPAISSNNPTQDAAAGPAKPSPRSNVAPTQLQNRRVAETVVSTILDRIKEEARSNGGQLSLHNIDSLRSEFEAQTQALSMAFEQSFETYILARERAAWSNKRDFPFDRLIVKTFSHLFSDKKAGFDRVSRRMLPGFFMAVGMMLGPDVVDEMQETCRIIVERIRADKAEQFDWSDVYDSVEKNGVIMDALLPIAVHFEELEKRREWFISLINGHLSPAVDGEKEDAGWEMTVPGFGHFMNALLADLRTELASKTGKPRIIKRYGADDARTALRVLNKLR